jgi:hypothetical protein
MVAGVISPPIVRWLQDGKTFDALWRSESAAPPAARVIIADGNLTGPPDIGLVHAIDDRSKCGIGQLAAPWRGEEKIAACDYRQAFVKRHHRPWRKGKSRKPLRSARALTAPRKRRAGRRVNYS